MMRYRDTETQSEIRMCMTINDQQFAPPPAPASPRDISNANIAEMIMEMESRMIRMIRAVENRTNDMAAGVPEDDLATFAI